MTSFIDRIRGAAKGVGEANSSENAQARLGPLTIGNLIEAGGEGTVYEDRNDPGMVIKVLHPQYATPERYAKLRTMCGNPPQNSQALSWPNDVETDGGGLQYRMPKASPGASKLYRFVSANERRQLPPRQQEYEYRARLGVKIAEAFRELHVIHVRIGDVNPSNILVSGDGSVMLIDCDSFQIPGPPGHQPYPCVVGSPEYTAPEIDDFRRQFRSHDSDNFALAVLLYQLLGNGSHPYQGIDASADDAVSNIRERIKQHRFAHQPREGRWRPTLGQVRSWRSMPEPVRNAFEQAFSPGASHIGRPTADAWVSILNRNAPVAGTGNLSRFIPIAKAGLGPCASLLLVTAAFVFGLLLPIGDAEHDAEAAAHPASTIANNVVMDGGADQRGEVSTLPASTAADHTLPATRANQGGEITGLAMSNPSPGKLVIVWDAVKPEPTDYRVSWTKSDEAFPSWRNSAGNAYPTDNYHIISGLDDGGAYKVRVRSRYSGDGESGRWSGPWSAKAIQIVAAAPNPTPKPTQGVAEERGPVPGQPTGLTASETRDTITLTWDDLIDPSIIGYQILRRSRDGHAYGDGQGAADFVAVEQDTQTTQTSYVDHSVAPRTRYVYRVRALNENGVSPRSKYVNAETWGSSAELIAKAHGTPISHDGKIEFTFDLRFSEQFPLSYKTLRNHAFSVTGGEVTSARRLEPPSNIAWQITVRPVSNGNVYIVLPATEDCGAPGAICTKDGRMLSNKLRLTISGPDG